MEQNFTQLSPEVFRQYLNSWEYTLLDLRTREELDQYWKISDFMQKNKFKHVFDLQWWIDAWNYS